MGFLPAGSCILLTCVTVIIWACSYFLKQFQTFQHHVVQFSFLLSVFLTPLSDSKQPGFHYLEYIYVFNQFHDALGPLFHVDTLFDSLKMPTLHTKPSTLPGTEARLTMLGCPLWTNDTFVQRKWYLVLLPESSPMPRYLLSLARWLDGLDFTSLDWPTCWVSRTQFYVTALVTAPDYTGWVDGRLLICPWPTLGPRAAAPGGMLLCEPRRAEVRLPSQQVTRPHPKSRVREVHLGAVAGWRAKNLDTGTSDPVYYGEGQVVCQRLTRW